MLVQLKGWWRIAVLVPTLSLTAFVWENLMIEQPAVTRSVLFGLLLIAVMTIRPQGLSDRQRSRSSEWRACSSSVGVSKAFGGLQVISELDFDVDENEIVSVIGPNGAGKTTLFNLITGVYEPDEGDIRFEDRSIVGLPPYQINQRGIARTFQNLRLFLNMTVKENVIAAAYGHTHAGVGPVDPAHAGDATRREGDQRAGRGAACRSSGSA